jgi:NADPH:quinone reductase-like Zn-dependent oxidoreductase
MKAIVCEEYGPPEDLRLEEVEKPTPKGDEVLVKLEATSLNSFDHRLLRAEPFLVRFMGGGFIRPKHRILGADISGHVEAAGKDSQRFKPGDQVFGDLASSGCGGLAEYVCAPEGLLALKPAKMGFDEAAAIPMAAITALQGLRDQGKIKPRQKVLINGASGGVGSFAVQIAKAFGAEVTAVCSTGKIDAMRSLGAEHVIDYKKEDFSRNGRRYDLILGVNGYHPLLDYKRSLAPQGTYVMIGGSTAQIFEALLLGPWVSMGGTRKLIALTAGSNPGDLDFLATLYEGGRLKPVIDRRYPLSEIVDAFRHLEEGHPLGKIVITI